VGLFVSYSSQDRSLIEPLAAALRRARQQVWFDEDLGGGEAWWSEILEQIRSCGVFVVALSNHSLESKPCQAEWRYAQALQRPILPVRIGPVDSMRANPLAALQVIDYQNPTVDTGIQLVTAVHQLTAQQRPLPSPLPEEPPVPFAYLMRLSGTLAEQALDPREQTHLLTELKSGLEEDGDDPTARNDIARLLRMLRDRSDVTYRTRTEIDDLLTSVDATRSAPAASRPQHEHPVAGATPPAPATAAKPQPSHPTTSPPPSAGPQPRVSTQPTVPSGDGGAEAAPPSHKRLLIAGGAALAVVIAVAAAVLIFAQKPSPAPSSAPAAAGPPPAAGPPAAGPPPSDLGSILLGAPDLSTIMNASMASANQTDHMLTSPGTWSNPGCVGAFEAIQAPVYQGSGFTAVRGQGLRSTNPPHRVYQAAVEFPSAESAHAFVRRSAGDWHACAGQTVTVTDGNQKTTWTFGDVNGAAPRIVLRRTEAGTNVHVCQHVLSAVSRVVIDVHACGQTIANEAGQIADQMAAKVTP
jgi:serine/threonine kinase PknH